MKLVDVMSASGLSGYAIIALLLFVIAFVAVVLLLFAPGQAARHAADARLPFTDDESRPAQRAGE